MGMNKSWICFSPGTVTVDGGGGDGGSRGGGYGNGGCDAITRWQ